LHTDRQLTAKSRPSIELSDGRSSVGSAQTTALSPMVMFAKVLMQIVDMDKLFGYIKDN
jgi:hypothetical protein